MKTIILLEMAVVAGGGLVKHKFTFSQNARTPESAAQLGGTVNQTVKGQQNWWIAIHDSLRLLIAVLILTVLLLSADEVGLGQAAALFGGLVALAYVMNALGWLGPGVQQVEQELLG